MYKQKLLVLNLW